MVGYLEDEEERYKSDIKMMQKQIDMAHIELINEKDREIDEYIDLSKNIEITKKRVSCKKVLIEEE